MSLCSNLVGRAGVEGGPPGEGTPPVASNGWSLFASPPAICVWGISSWVCAYTYPKARLVSQNSLSYYFLSSSSLMQSACMGTQRALDLPGAWQRS